MHGRDVAPRPATQGSPAQRDPLRYGVPRELAEEADGSHLCTPADER